MSNEGSLVERRKQANLCTRCGEPAERFKSMCTTCLRKKVEHNKRYYYKNRKALVELYKRRRKYARENNLCIRCLEKKDVEIDGDNSYCLTCREYYQ